MNQDNEKFLEDFVQETSLARIKEIKLNKINQFENLTLDLSYPKGHKKEGKPLDKVCFIGQNGTGKTSILKIIKDFIKQEAKNILNSDKKTNIEISFTKNKELAVTSFFSDEKFVYIGRFKDKSLNLQKENFNIEKQYINFPADIIDKTYNQQQQQMQVQKQGIIDFDIISAQKTWELVKQEIIKYNNEEKTEREKISKIINTESASKIKELAEKFEIWKKENPSPVEKLASECLNRFLKSFNLKVKTKLDFSKESDINQIKIENLQGEELGNLENTLSTGTKQILYTAMPLYTLKPESTIVLFDEPERSLYPDIQKEIIEFYTSLSPKSQFFFATHSPIIASSFEPWEIVELEFDENGKVKQKLWYDEKEGRHVNNYRTDARYLSWDDIFMKLFGMKQDGSKLRIRELMKVASMKSKIKKGKYKEEEKDEKYAEYSRLTKLVNYNLGELENIDYERLANLVNEEIR